MCETPLRGERPKPFQHHRIYNNDNRHGVLHEAFLIEGYIIFYEVLEDEITILRVVSGRQNLEALFGESD
ncbi:MAG: type II toxin-antitoxin system RelE/ParE family toxin [Alkalinema sp. FL-bin-369]|nr:type II toxin-antitoxin system RelE/ParE family toxin [Leptolyngbyaceae cyanobacterium LF-bin-369]